MLNPKSKQKYTVEQATEILREYGLSTSTYVTNRLVREGKLLGYSAGTNPNDRRSGTVIQEDELYNFVSREIPAINAYQKELGRLKKALRAYEKAAKPDTDKQE